MDQNPTKKCPQCQSEISIQAKKCPHCRSKIPQPISKLTAGFIIVVAVIFFAAMFYAGNGSPATTANTQDDPKSWAWVYPQMVVKQVLKSPSTAKFCDATVTELGENKYQIASCVDSQNSFGAMIRSNWGAVVTYSGSNPQDSTSWKFDKITFNGKVIYSAK